MLETINENITTEHDDTDNRYKPTADGIVLDNGEYAMFLVNFDIDRDDNVPGWFVDVDDHHALMVNDHIPAALDEAMVNDVIRYEGDVYGYEVLPIDSDMHDVILRMIHDIDMRKGHDVTELYDDFSCNEELYMNGNRIGCRIDVIVNDKNREHPIHSEFSYLVMSAKALESIGMDESSITTVNVTNGVMEFPFHFVEK